MKKVRCTNCGFLSWGISSLLDSQCRVYKYDEIVKFDRQRISNKTRECIFTEDAEQYEASCFRGQWVFSNIRIEDKEINYADVQSIGNPRQCQYYFGYVPSFKPDEHKELQREAKVTKSLIQATIIGALAGGILAIAAQLLYNLFVSK